MNIKELAIYDHVISNYTYNQLYDITCHGFFEVAYDIEHPYDMSYYLDLNRFYSKYGDEVWLLLKDAAVFLGYRPTDSLAITGLLSESKTGFTDHNSFIKAIVWTAIEHIANEIISDIDQNYPRAFTKFLKDNYLRLSEVDLNQAKNGIFVAGNLTGGDSDD